MSPSGCPSKAMMDPTIPATDGDEKLVPPKPVTHDSAMYPVMSAAGPAMSGTARAVGLAASPSLHPRQPVGGAPLVKFPVFVTLVAHSIARFTIGTADWNAGSVKMELTPPVLPPLVPLSNVGHQFQTVCPGRIAPGLPGAP